MNNWLVATYKMNEVSKIEANLLNQNFNYYLPKIKSKKINSSAKVEILFPGYIFIYTNIEKLSVLKYTRGIKNIIKFGNNISCMTESEIKSIKIIEEESNINPVTLKIQIGQDAIISKGSLKGNIVKICSLPSKERVNILLSFLGSMRKVNIPQKDLTF
tara:strand:+ start:211 stop:687 length:477 start_codon:yes stop_codon:yes gene_type:complete